MKISTSSDQSEPCLQEIRDFLCNHFQETRDLSTIPPPDLNEYLTTYLLDGRRADGSEFEPEWLAIFRRGLEDYLMDNNYPLALSHDVFQSTNDVYSEKGGGFRQETMVDRLPAEIEEKFWNEGQLGSSDGETINFTLIYLFGKFFGFKTKIAIKNMCFGDVVIKSGDGVRYLEYDPKLAEIRYSGTDDLRSRLLSHQEDNDGHFEPKIVFEGGSPERDPVKLFEEFTSHRPSSTKRPSSPMYLQPVTSLQDPNSNWFDDKPLISKSLNRIVRCIARGVKHSRKRPGRTGRNSGSVFENQNTNRSENEAADKSLNDTTSSSSTDNSGRNELGHDTNTQSLPRRIIAQRPVTISGDISRANINADIYRPRSNNIPQLSEAYRTRYDAARHIGTDTERGFTQGSERGDKPEDEMSSHLPPEEPSAAVPAGETWTLSSVLRDDLLSLHERQGERGDRGRQVRQPDTGFRSGSPLANINGIFGGRFRDDSPSRGRSPSRYNQNGEDDRRPRLTGRERLQNRLQALRNPPEEHVQEKQDRRKNRRWQTIGAEDIRGSRQQYEHNRHAANRYGRDDNYLDHEDSILNREMSSYSNRNGGQDGTVAVREPGTVAVRETSPVYAPFRRDYQAPRFQWMTDVPRQIQGSGYHSPEFERAVSPARNSREGRLAMSLAHLDHQPGQNGPVSNSHHQSRQVQQRVSRYTTGSGHGTYSHENRYGSFSTESRLGEYSESRAGRYAQEDRTASYNDGNQNIYAHESKNAGQAIQTSSSPHGVENRSAMFANRERLAGYSDDNQTAIYASRDRMQSYTSAFNSADPTESNQMMATLEEGSEKKYVTSPPSKVENRLDDLSGLNVKSLLQVGKIQPKSPSAHRKLILDEEKLQELFLRCFVCHEDYDQSEKMPKVLPCHHTFCLKCMLDIFRVENEHRQNITAAYRNHYPSAIRIGCPTCREAIIVSQEEIRKLPTDRTVMALLEVVSQSEACVVTYCSRHQTQPLNFFCETCIVPVCCDCTVLDHRQQDDHVVLNIEDAMKTYVPMIETTLEELVTTSKELLEKKTLLDSLVNNIDVNRADVETRLKETFQHFKTSADDREEELVEISERELGGKRGELQKYLEAVQTRRALLKSTGDKIKSAQGEEVVEDVFKNHESLKEALVDNITIPETFAEEMSTALQFDEEEQSVVLLKLSEFGEVIFEHTIS